MNISSFLHAVDPVIECQIERTFVVPPVPNGQEELMCDVTRDALVELGSVKDHIRMCDIRPDVGDQEVLVCDMLGSWNDSPILYRNPESWRTAVQHCLHLMH